MGLIAGQGTKIPQVAQHGQKKMVNYMLCGFYFHIKKIQGLMAPQSQREFFAEMGPGLRFKEPPTGNECLFVSLL